MATDPVCYMVIDEDRTTTTATYNGTTYYFCTASCRRKFLENPEKYAKLTTTITIDPGASC
ncbi:MAG: YHS domain-containing protein [Methanomicrobiales archaeon]|nr:YHS domain-containing protein [Methanomicrobiales archaeon]